MKTKIYTIAATLLMGLTACNNWFEVNSSTQIKGDDLFSTQSGYHEALTGIYLNLASTDMYGKNMSWFYVDLLACPWYNFGNTNDIYYVMSGKHTTTQVRSYVDAIWTKSYTTIASINNALKYVESDTKVLSSVERNLIRGELLGLRAFIHLDLMRLFGYGNYAAREDFATRLTIPYVSVYTKEQTPQQTYDKTIELIIADLEAATKALADDPIRGQKTSSYYGDMNADGYWDNRNLHLNYYGVQAALARAYLWQNTDESIGKAAVIAQQVIDAQGKGWSWVEWSSLNTDDKFVDRIFSNENIFAVNVYNLINAVGNYMTDLTYNSEATTPVLNQTDVEYTIYNTLVNDGYYDGDDNWIDNIVPGAGADDWRYAKQMSLTIRNSTYYYMCRKLYQPNNSTNSAYKYLNRVPVIKIAEMYYILAENCLRKSDNQGALDQINVVRAHRGMTTPLTLDLIENKWGTTVETELLKEYLKEFVQEGQLFYYLKRHGYRNYADVSLSLNNDITFDDERYVLPYPDDEVNLGNRQQ